MGRPFALAVALLLLACLACGLEENSGVSTSTPASSPTASKTSPATMKPSPTTTKTSQVTTKPSPTTTKTSQVTTKPSPTTTKTSHVTTKPSTATTKTSPATTKTSHVTTKTTSYATTTSTSHTSNTSTSYETTNTTTLEPTTTTAIPEEHYYYNVSSGGKGSSKTYCILFKGQFSFNITYEVKTSNGTPSNKTKTAHVTTPENPQKGSKVTGECGDKQWMAFDWDGVHTIGMNFTRSKDNATWALGDVTAVILMDPKSFPDAVDENEKLIIVSNFTLDPSDIDVNNSYSCVSSVNGNLLSAEINETMYDFNVNMTLNEDFQLEGYNSMPAGNFTTATNCTVKTNDIIPIVVGCCLGGLVVIVLIAYIVGHKRRKAAYESTA